MSYQVLARKWRPRKFEDMVGQEHVLQALIHALDNDRLHHAYLFTGTRGVGKTTIGRLLARCLNCETGVTARPCGECDSCREIQEGRFVDLIEIDAASRTGVDDMRELTDNVQYAPTRGRFKVYLIDEIHMLSNQSFNAFLKTLEEPPEHVKFLLATTDPQKLPVTVLSRCLQFNLKRMTPEHIVSHLSHVLTEEQVPFEDPALWLLARAADGSMRDALSLTDQAIAYGNQSLSQTDVSSMLGTIDQRSTQKLVACLVDNDGPALLGEIQRISEFAPDYSVILEDLLSLFHRVTMEQVVPGSVDNAMGDAAQVKTLARQLSAEDAQLFYQTALIGRKDLEVTPDARMGFEMTLLRMLAFRPGSDRRAPPATAGASQTSAGGEEPEPGPPGATQEQAPEPQPEPESQPEPAPEPEPDPEPQSQPHPEPDGPPLDAYDELDGGSDNEPGPAPEPEATLPAEPGAQPDQAMPVAEPAPEPVTTPPTAGGEFDWQRDYRTLGIVGMPGNLASQAALTVEGSEITLTLDEGHFRLLTDRHREKILAGLQQQFGDGIVLKVEQGSPGNRTPAAWEEDQRRQRQEAAVKAIQNDPLVASIVERFEGRVVENSIRPR